jgi:subtilisin family serine protease
MVRPIFSEVSVHDERLPVATLQMVADAIIECVNAGARLINVSASLPVPSGRAERGLLEALDYAAERNAIVVVAAGNEGVVAGSVITQHPWVLSVVACDSEGAPTRQSNLGRSIAMGGMLAPGENITSVDAAGGLRPFVGTSAAAPVVTGTLALLWSLFPFVSASDLRDAIMGPGGRRRRLQLVPPLLDAWAAHEYLSAQNGKVIQ